MRSSYPMSPPISDNKNERKHTLGSTSAGLVGCEVRRILDSPAWLLPTQVDPNGSRPQFHSPLPPCSRIIVICEHVSCLMMMMMMMMMLFFVDLAFSCPGDTPIHRGLSITHS